MGFELLISKLFIQKLLYLNQCFKGNIARLIKFHGLKYRYYCFYLKFRKNYLLGQLARFELVDYPLRNATVLI